MAIPRIVASLMLGFVILASLLCYLLLVKITKRLEDPEIYRTAFTETDAYNRVYDEVLVDAAVQEQTLDMLGGVSLETALAKLVYLEGMGTKPTPRWGTTNP